MREKRKKNYTHGNTFFKKLDSVDEMWKEKINKKFLNIDNQVNEKLRMSKN